MMAIEAAGREWADRLRLLSRDLADQGQHARARELARLAGVAEREVAGIHDRRMVAAAAHDDDGWCGHWHATFAEAFACAGLIPAREVSHAHR